MLVSGLPVKPHSPNPPADPTRKELFKDRDYVSFTAQFKSYERMSEWMSE
jgi:hypothetical protein